ncbi:MAG: glyoxylate/hydroxypyruvate reductase A, partial [Colwellia sp.]|nr:glyoxylate/hydroxypyruvate reductase A [Colwellia sp.]
ARGGIINNADLLANLDSNHLAHAVLDVFEEEPLNMNSHLWQQPNLTVLPHVSAPTHCLSAGDIVAKNIKSYRKTGEIPKFVDFARGY